MSETPDAPHGGAGLKGALGKKLGPLPVGIWVLAVGGGLIFAYYMRSNSSGDDVTEDTSGTDTGGTGEGSYPYGVPNGVGQWAGSGSGTTEDDAEDKTLPTTNEQWQRRAVQILIGRGYEAVAVDRAISAYLGGESLTTIQRAIINEAILLIGPPPVSPPSPTSPDSPPPTTTPPNPKPDTPAPPTPTTDGRVMHPAPAFPKPQASKPKNVYPKRWKSVVNGANSSYSKLSAKYKLGLSGQALYDYQFSKEAGRSAAT
ncbi:hypothetical protein G3I26_18775, partial [Streptomyces sp. SID7909]|nr:hypothetical protein [Streptomyces sp. SID7909]